MAMSDNMVTIGCVLRSGGVYNRSHVLQLKKQADRNADRPYKFVCLTDESPIGGGVISLPLEKNHPGWWSCCELWKLCGPTVVVGLDTAFVDDLGPLFDLALQADAYDFWMLRSFFHPYDPHRDLINGIQIWNGDWSWLWNEFEYERDVKLFRGDENYLLDRLKGVGVRCRKIQDKVAGIYSYPLDCKSRIPKDARVIVFHGKYKPWSCIHRKTWNI